MKRLLPVVATASSLMAIVLTGAALVAQQPQQSPAAPPRHPSPANMDQAKLDDMLIRFPLPAGQQAYADIDGKKIHRYVVEQAQIARRYRDQGHPKFWGRIIGTSADAEDVEWMLAKFKAAGLTDVRSQPFDLVPQWFPQSWEVTLTGGGKTLSLDSAQPDYGAVGTPPDGLDLEAVYVGLGSEADYSGRDVKGKAVFVFTMLGAPNEGAVRRASEKGAAAIFEVNMLPGNARYQAYPARTTGPAFTVGHDDGTAAREIIASMPAGQPARLKVKLSVQRVPNLKTALIWGTLPGATDETIYIMAHRDGWFDASGDNASGVASMIGLAEHYSKLPQAQRKRTMIFVALDGHHNSGEGSAVGNQWIIREQAEAVRQDGPGHQHRASIDDPDAVAAPLLQRQRDRLGQHLHAPAMVRGRPVPPRTAEDRRRRLQALRRDDGSLSRIRRHRRAT